MLQRLNSGICVAALLGVLTFHATAQEALPAEEVTPFAKHFVLVKTYFKRSENEFDQPVSPLEWAESLESEGQYERFLDGRRPKRMIGIILSDDTVLAGDFVLDDDYVSRFEVEDVYGNASPAERQAILRDAPALLLRVMQPDKLRASPVGLGTAITLDGESRTYEVTASYDGASWFVHGSPLSRLAELDPAGGTRPMLQTSVTGPNRDHLNFLGISDDGFTSGGPALVLNGERNPIGIAVHPRLPLEAGIPPIWRGTDLSSARRVTFEEIKEQEDDLASLLAGAPLEVKMTFRQTADEEDQISMFGVSIPTDFDPMSFFEEDLPPEAYYYGLPVGPGRLFVPSRMQRDRAKKIDSVSVTIGDTSVEGWFAGAFKNIAAFIVEMDPQHLQGRVDLSTEALVTYEPLTTIRSMRRFGERTLEINYSRVVEWRRGYRDILEPVTLDAGNPGTFYVDFDGAIRGVALEQRTHGEDIAQLLEGWDRWDTPRWHRVYSMAELASYFSAPESLLDKTIVALPEDEEKRRMWLGVEYEPITPELAKTLSVEKPTKGGTVGAVLSIVYPDSPAAGLRLQSGDVLLRIEPGDDLDPIELKAPADDLFDFDEFDFEMPEMVEGLGFSFPERRPWKSRDNLLTRILEVLGDGAEVRLSYWRSGEVTVVPFTVERAPRDYDSATKLKDETTGLTVKELTYEVRDALQILEDQNPVVVSKVEEGSPAAVARIQEYDLIIRADETSINGLDTIQQFLEGLEGDETSPLRLTLQRLGQTRIVDLNVD